MTVSMEAPHNGQTGF